VTTQSTGQRLLARREVLRILAVGGAAGAAWSAGLLGRAPVAERTRTLMGTSVRLAVVGDDREAAEAAAEAALGRMAQLEALLSRYRPGSEVWRLNETGRVEDASPALREVLGLAQRIAALGDGAFDVTVQPVLDLYREHRRRGALPPAAALEEAVGRVDGRALALRGGTVLATRPGLRVTLDGIGKGYVVDRGVEALRERGFRDVFVEAGGDLMASGRRVSGDPWRIGIRRPRGGGLALQARTEARDRAVATSGDYMQPFTDDRAQHHILDPRTGRSAPELASATVVAPDAATADGLATLAMVLGPRRARDLLESLDGCEGYLVDKQLGVTRTSGFVVVSS